MSTLKAALGSTTVRRVLSTRARRKVFAVVGNAVGRKTMYHVTPDERVASIMRQGLREGSRPEWRPGIKDKNQGIFVGNLLGTHAMRYAGPSVTAQRAAMEAGDIFGAAEKARAAVRKPHTLFRVRVARHRLQEDPHMSAARIVRGRIAPKHLKKTTFGREYAKKGATVTAGGAVVLTGQSAAERKFLR